MDSSTVRSVMAAALVSGGQREGRGEWGKGRRGGWGRGAGGREGEGGKWERNSTVE